VPGRIEDYAIVGDMEPAALVSTAGPVDWLCLPRFDSDACFAALLGRDDHGSWRIAPAEELAGTGRAAVSRHYAGGTLILRTRRGHRRPGAQLPPRRTAARSA
jgi:GH15 family glucan-1,4-alpha-glucosidase